MTTDDGLSITCVYADGDYHDIYQVTSGTTTCAANQANSCPDGMDIWVPRSYDHAKAVYDIYGMSGTYLVGIYRPESGCGSCTSYAMNSDAMAIYEANTNGVGWTSVAPIADPWFMRETTYSEPNGDYTAYCWLYIYAWNDGTGWDFNDANCGYCYSRYLCSTNIAEGAQSAL